MTEEVVFVLCTERGPLETMTTLFVRSLRKFGGSFKDNPVYSFAPRAGHDIGEETAEAFLELGVKHLHLPLNREFIDYPLGNKPLVTAYAEANLEADIIVFVDSDMVLLSEPASLRIPPGFDIGLRPVDIKGIGIVDLNDRESEYWKRLFEICNVRKFSYVETTVDRRRIHSYWNSGLIACRRHKQLFSLWAANFTRIMREGVVPKRSNFFVEQSCLAATVVGAEANVYEFPPAYNYPLHLHPYLAPPTKIRELKNIVLAHYHGIFNSSDGQNPLSSLLGDDEQSRWLANELKVAQLH